MVRLESFAKMIHNRLVTSGQIACTEKGDDDAVVGAVRPRDCRALRLRRAVGRYFYRIGCSHRIDTCPSRKLMQPLEDNKTIVMESVNDRKFET